MLSWILIFTLQLDKKLVKKCLKTWRQKTQIEPKMCVQTHHRIKVLLIKILQDRIFCQVFKLKLHPQRQYFRMPRKKMTDVNICAIECSFLLLSPTRHTRRPRSQTNSVLKLELTTLTSGNLSHISMMNDTSLWFACSCKILTAAHPHKHPTPCVSIIIG